MADDITYYLAPNVGDMVTMSISEKLAEHYAQMTKDSPGYGQYNGPLIRSIRHQLKKAGGPFELVGIISGVDGVYSVTTTDGEIISLLNTQSGWINANFPSVEEYLPGEPRIQWGAIAFQPNCGYVNPIHFANSLVIWNEEEYELVDDSE